MGRGVTRILKSHLAEANQKSGLPWALRVTPTDIRENGKPPQMRRGDAYEQLCRSFELNAEAGADILSIESIGGNEVHDAALVDLWSNESVQNVRAAIVGQRSRSVHRGPRI